MKKILIFPPLLFLFLILPSYSQTLESEAKVGYGYAFVTPGAYIGEGVGTTLNLGGGGEGLLKGGLGASADLSYVFFPKEGFRSGLGLFSPGVLYQFRTSRKTVPFVTGGYSMAFRNGVYNMVHLGGGFNHWFDNRWGVRFEVRDHVDPRAPEYNFLQFRFALLFH